jgi:hypothetical protein
MRRSMDSTPRVADTPIAEPALPTDSVRSVRIPAQYSWRDGGWRNE